MVIPQTGVLQNAIEERVERDSKTFGYLDEAYKMLNHMPLISRSCVLLPFVGVQIGALGLKNLYLRSIGEYKINRFCSKLIFAISIDVFCGVLVFAVGTNC